MISVPPRALYLSLRRNKKSGYKKFYELSLKDLVGDFLEQIKEQKKEES